MGDFMFFNYELVVEHLFFHFIQDSSQIFNVFWSFLLAFRCHTNVTVDMEISFLLDLWNSLWYFDWFLAKFFFFTGVFWVLSCQLLYGDPQSLNLGLELSDFLIAAFWAVWFLETLEAFDAGNEEAEFFLIFL